MRDERRDSSTVEVPGGGTAIEVTPLAAAELAADRRQRRRRRVLQFVVPAIVIGLAVALTQVRLTGGVRAPSPAVADWTAGMRLIESGDTADGLAMLEALVEQLPEGAHGADGHVRLARVYRTLGEGEVHYLNSAIRHYRVALDDADCDVPVDALLYESGLCFVRLGSYGTALDLFERLEAECPESTYRPDARFQVAECSLASGQYVRARRVFAEMAETYRGDPLGEKAFFRFADSFDVQARSLESK